MLKAKKLEEEEKARPQKELLEQINAIKEYRTEYGAATELPAKPDEPLLAGWKFIAREMKLRRRFMVYICKYPMGGKIV